MEMSGDGSRKFLHFPWFSPPKQMLWSREVLWLSVLLWAQLKALGLRFDKWRGNYPDVTKSRSFGEVTLQEHSQKYDSRISFSRFFERIFPGPPKNTACRTKFLNLFIRSVTPLKFPAPSHFHFQNLLCPTCRRSTTRVSTRASDGVGKTFWDPFFLAKETFETSGHFVIFAVYRNPPGVISESTTWRATSAWVCRTSSWSRCAAPPLPVDSEAGRNRPQVFEEMHLLNLIGFFWRIKPHPKKAISVEDSLKNMMGT